MDDQRQEPRTHLIYYLKVYETSNNALFGHVVDISKNGLLITSDKPMQQDAQYTLEIEDVSTLDDMNTVGVLAECRWCNGDGNDSLFDAGFRLVNPSTQMMEILDTYQ